MAGARDADGGAIKQLDADALTFYTNLTDAQKAIVIDVVKTIYQDAQTRGNPPSGRPGH
jgi:hypothetical protein